MRGLTKIPTALGAAALALVPAAAASAAGPTTTTYHGVFGGAVTYEKCVLTDSSTKHTPPLAEASGVWSVALHGADTATLTVNITVNGVHHVSFGATADQTRVRGAES